MYTHLLYMQVPMAGTEESAHLHRFSWAFVAGHYDMYQIIMFRFNNMLYLVVSLSCLLISVSLKTYEPWHEISNNVVCGTSKTSDQPAHTRSLIRAFGSRLNIIWLLSYCHWTSCGVSKLKMRMHRLVWVYNCQNATLLESHVSAHITSYMLANSVNRTNT